MENDNILNIANHSSKSLKFFMKEEKEEIITAPAPEGFVDEEGNLLELEIKIIPNARVQEIFQNYTKRSVARNNKGVPYVAANNEALYTVDRDNARAVRHIIVESLVYPNLRDPELMKFYKCNDITEMPNKVFPKTAQYAHVSKMIMDALGLGDNVADEEGLIDDAKN